MKKMNKKTNYKLIPTDNQSDEKQQWQLVYIGNQVITIRGQEFEVKDGDLGPVFDSPESIVGQLFFLGPNMHIPAFVRFCDNVAITNCTFGRTKAGSIKIVDSIVSGSHIEAEEILTKIEDATVSSSKVFDTVIKRGTISASELGSLVVENSEIKNSTVLHDYKGQIENSVVEASNFKVSRIFNSVVRNSKAEYSELNDGSMLEDSHIVNSKLTRVTAQNTYLYWATVEDSIIECHFPVFDAREITIFGAIIQNTFDACFVGDRYFWRCNDSAVLEYESGVRTMYTHICSRYQEDSEVKLWPRDKEKGEKTFVTEYLREETDNIESDTIAIFVEASQKDVCVPSLAQRLYCQIMIDWIIDRLEKMTYTSLSPIIREKIMPFLNIDLFSKEIVGILRAIDQSSFSLIEREWEIDKEVMQKIIKDNNIFVVPDRVDSIFVDSDS